MGSYIAGSQHHGCMLISETRQQLTQILASSSHHEAGGGAAVVPCHYSIWMLALQVRMGNNALMVFDQWLSN